VSDGEGVRLVRLGGWLTLALLTPEHDEQSLRDAGFAQVILLFAAFTWGSRVAYAAPGVPTNARGKADWPASALPLAKKKHAGARGRAPA
jgi:hypothetical protein